MDTVGVYIQVPFCQTKCTYCNFHTGVVSAGRFAPYVAAVCREIRAHLQCGSRAAAFNLPSAPPDSNLLSTNTVDTIYIGGGTPSLLEPELITQMLGAVHETFSCEFAEVTLEADPETVDTEKATQWATLGINRISIGTQSFVDEELKAAGRM